MSRPLTKNVLVDAGLDLLAALTSAKGHAISLAQAQADLALNASQLGKRRRHACPAVRLAIG